MEATPRFTASFPKPAEQHTRRQRDVKPVDPLKPGDVVPAIELRDAAANASVHGKRKAVVGREPSCLRAAPYPASLSSKGCI